PNGYKKSLRHPHYVPDFALIDPELMLTCPPSLTASCSMDAFTQLVEGFLSTQSSAITDAIAWSGIEAVQRSLVQAFQDGNDLKARTDMAYAALCSGIVLANAGLGVIHGLAPALGSRFSIPHGVVCGTMMGAGNEITLKKLHELERSDSQYQPFLFKYRRLGRLFSKERAEGNHESESFIREVHRMIDLLGLPRLSDYGARQEELVEVIDAVSSKNNPVILSKADIQKILLLRL
ncbi:MAG: iron-containing alcohol dehydrogenase, partial [Desulfocapsaceae bacterium]